MERSSGLTANAGVAVVQKGGQCGDCPGGAGAVQSKGPYSVAAYRGVTVGELLDESVDRIVGLRAHVFVPACGARPRSRAYGNRVVSCWLESAAQMRRDGQRLKPSLQVGASSATAG